VEISELMSAGAEMVALARETLPPAVANEWIGLLRPAIWLRPAEPTEQPVAQLGGSPALPDCVPWPRSEAGLPLGFVAGIDLARLPVDQLDVPLPVDGTLLLFYRDPLEDYPEMEQRDGGPLPDRAPAPLVLYVPAGVATTVQAAPAGAATYPAVPLAGEPIATGPHWEHPALAKAVARLSDADRAFVADQDDSEPFRDEITDKIDYPRHRIGGHAYSVQGPVEVEVAHQHLGGRVSYSDPALNDEAARWTLLVQIDSPDDDPGRWGDCGLLYWLMRPADIAAGRFDAAEFMLQCS
jgi:hypothetical protein